jgi:hypothetical protein
VQISHITVEWNDLKSINADARLIQWARVAVFLSELGENANGIPATAHGCDEGATLGATRKVGTTLKALRRRTSELAATPAG